MEASTSASSSELPASPAAAPPPPTQRIRRAAPQLLADELVSEELLAGAPSRNGGRLLTEDRDPWTHNAWDKVDWDDEQEQIALEMVRKQASTPVSEDLRALYNANPAYYWDGFYANHKENFFNDRAWLCNEYPELGAALLADAGPKRIVEIGCGPGNTLFPLFANNQNPQLKLHGFDFSKEAVDLVRGNAAFDPAYLDSQVWDLSSQGDLPATLEEGSVDIAIMIFVLSALHPREWENAVNNVYRMLKPGGVVLFRDYGRHDMAQLRFKANRYMDENFYIRGDNTRVYFFERDELVNLFGAPSASSPSTLPSLENLSLHPSSEAVSPSAQHGESTSTPVSPSVPTPSSSLVGTRKLHLIQLGVDRRLLLNRKKQLKMYRVWLQGRWMKPLE